MSAVSAAVVCSAAQTSRADTTWISTSNQLFTTTGNWSNGLPSTGPQLAIFSGTSGIQRTIDIQGTTARNAVGLQFTSAPGIGGFTFNSTTNNSPGFQNRAGGTANGIQNLDDDNQTFNVAVKMFSSTGVAGATAAQTFDSGSGGLTFTGNNAASGSTVDNNGGALTITGSGSVTIGIAGATKGDLVGAGAVIKNGTGTLDLGGSTANSFSGGFTLNNGTVRAGKPTALGVAGGAVAIAGGTLAMTDGTGRTLNYAYTFSGDLTLGQATGGTGAVTLAGTADLGGAGRTITVNNASDTISAVINNGSLTKDGTGVLALTGANLYTGSTTILNGQVNISTTSTLGNGTGALNLAGGKLNTTGNRTVTSDPVANPINLTNDSAITTTGTAATTNLNLSNSSITGTAGKTLTIRSDSATANAVFDVRFSGSGFTLASNVDIGAGAAGTTRLSSFNTTGTTQTFTGSIVGTSGSFRRTATTSGTGGTTIFAGNNTYTGGTAINDGVLLANNTAGSATGTGAITILGPGTLGGTGAVSGAITSTGKISPGDPAVSNGFGTLKTGDVTSNSGGSLLVDIDVSNTPAADLLDVTGAVSLTGSTVSLTLANAPAPEVTFVPQTYIIVNNDDVDTVTGTFDTILVSVPGYHAIVNTAYTGTDNLGRIGDGNDIAVEVSVPEPAALSGLLMGGLALLGRRRRVKAN
jgi:autotransporter-associated beta strand protein